MNPIPPVLAERLSRLRSGMLLDLPFFGSLIVRMPFTRDDSFATMATDGTAIYFNEQWTSACDDNELRYTVAHELLHPALGHLWRIDGRDLSDFNEACDYVVNQMLDDYAEDAVKQGRVRPWTRPPKFLTVERHPEYRGFGAEEIYDLIREGKAKQQPDQGNPGPPNPSGSGNGHPQPGGRDQPDPNAPPTPDPMATAPGPKPSAPGSFVPPPPDATDRKPGTEAGGDNLEDDWKIAVTQAEQCAKMKGNCPGAASELVSGLKEPKVEWKDVLREFITRNTRADYAWSLPNRRHLGRGFLLPSLHSERMGRLVGAFDSSGSTIGYRKDFASECQAAMDAVSPESFEIIVCDTKVQLVQRFEPGDTIVVDAKGGGGTDFRPVFAHVDADCDHDDPPAAMIFLTDLDGDFPEKAPDYPVLWIAIAAGSKTPPWGELVKVS